MKQLLCDCCGTVVTEMTGLRNSEPISFDTQRGKIDLAPTMYGAGFAIDEDGAICFLCLAKNVNEIAESRANYAASNTE